MQPRDEGQPQETQAENQEPEEQEQQPGEETPAEDVEAQGEGEGEGEAPETEEGEAPAVPTDEGEERRKRAGGWQRKIERLERERQLLMEQLAQRPAQPPPGPPKPKDSAAQMEDYISNLVEQRLAAAREQESQKRIQAEFQRRAAEVRAANPDFDDVLVAADAPVSPALQQALLTSEHGPAIMYQLAKNPGELARLNALPPFDAAREIGRLEAKASATPAPAKPTKSATRPPVPPTNVAGSPSSTRNLDDLPLAEYKRALRSKRR